MRTTQNSTKPFIFYGIYVNITAAAALASWAHSLAEVYNQPYFNAGCRHKMLAHLYAKMIRHIKGYVLQDLSARWSLDVPLYSCIPENCVTPESPRLVIDSEQL